MKWVVQWICFSIVIVSCNGNQIDDNNELELSNFSFRPSDNLLERRDLQQIVNFQNESDTHSLLKYFQDENPSIRARAAFA